MSDSARYIRLADLTQRRLPPASGKDLLRAGLFAVAFIALVIPLSALQAGLNNAWQESHGQANLARPSAQECGIVRLLVGDLHRSGEDAALLRSVGEHGLSLQTIAWNQKGFTPAAYRAPADQADSRWCAGFGPDVRALGWVRMGDMLHERATVSVSRPAFSADGTRAVVAEVFTPPVANTGLSPAAWRSDVRSWNTILERGAAGGWSVVGRVTAN